MVLLQEKFKQSVDFLSQQDIFHGHGVAVAEDEVVLLMMHVLAVDFNGLNQMVGRQLTPAENNQINTVLEQRVHEKKPMAYLVGFSVFAGLKFIIDQRALIPRSPFVELIDQGFAPWVDLSQPAKIMDLCTGSGCIGIAVAHYFPASTVDLVDISEPALQLAEANRKQHKLSARVQCIASNLFSQISKNSTYDLIIANPPYVGEDEYQNLPEEYNHEPKLALVSGMQGMEIPVKILYEASDYLSSNGLIFLEVGYNDELLAQCLPEVAFEWLTFDLGGQGICVFKQADLLKYRPHFKYYLESHVA